MKHCIVGILISCAAAVHAAPIPQGAVDDQAVNNRMLKGIETIANDSTVPASGALVRQLRQAEGKKLHLARPTGQSPANHDEVGESVAVVGIGYKCNKCPHWHMRSSGTAWIASEDGILVTNYHVLNNLPEDGRACVHLKNGQVHPIREVLASDKLRDVAIFRIDAKGLKPLAVGPDAPVGSNLHLISHPEGNYYMYTGGFVQRYTLRTTPNNQYTVDKNKSRRSEPIAWLVASCDYALGSSGGGIYNDNGEVVGMVSSTTTLYTPPRPMPVTPLPEGFEKSMLANKTTPAQNTATQEPDDILHKNAGNKTDAPEAKAQEPQPARFQMQRHPQMVLRHCVAGYTLREILYGE